MQVSRCQTSASEVQAAYNTSRTCDNIRIVELETEEDDKVEKLLEKFSEKFSANNR